MSKEREISYHLRMASKCKKYSMNATAQMRTYYLNKGREHLQSVKKIGLVNLGIEL